MRIEKVVLIFAAVVAVSVECLTPAHAQQLLDDLVVAVSNDRADQVKALIARGLDPDSVDGNGDPLIVTAARNGSERALDVLLAAKAKVDARNRFGDTALMLAALKGNLGIVKKLHAHGAAVNRTGWTPLIYGATSGNDDVVTYLLDQGADINAGAPNGTTALMMAVREHRIATAELLVKRGADIHHRNENGANALEWAVRGNETEFAERLRRAGAKN